MRKPLPNALDMDLRGGLTDAVTPHAGTSLLIDLVRRSQTLAAAEKALPTKQSPKGLSPGQMVEGVVVLSALGGDCLDDFDSLRRDRGLAALLGYDLPWRPRRASGWTASTTRRSWPIVPARAASSRPNRTRWPGCGPWCSTRSAPT